MLTPKSIAAAVRNATADTVLTDSTGEKGVGSLRLVIRGKNATWAGWWMCSGKQKKLALGRYPDMDLHQARAAFDEKVRQPLLAGKNPQTVPVKHSKPTVAALFQAYIDHLRAEGKVSADNFEKCLLTSSRNCADYIGRDRLAASITPGDIVACCSKWFDRGCRRQADYARTLMCAAFNYGLHAANSYVKKNNFDWGLTGNPVAAVEKDSAASQAGSRNLSVDEIRQLWVALGGRGFYFETAAAIRLILLCGQRVRETLRAEGRDFDLDAMIWRMPAHKTKDGLEHALPLPAAAVPIIRQLIDVHGRGWLFPARMGAKGVVMGDTALSHALRRWTKATGVDHFSPRDLRRTWKSRAGEAGVSKQMRDIIQQHAKSDTSGKHYDWADYLPQLRAAMATWDAWLASVLAEEPAGALADGGAVDAQTQAQLAAA